MRTTPISATHTSEQTMSPTGLCRHLSVVSTRNCKLGHDCRRVCSHRRRDIFVVSAVSLHRRHDATRQFRRVGVGGVYWTLNRDRSSCYERNIFSTAVLTLTFDL